MKKIGALSIAAFYLLLTTGMYVCILHCTGEYFFSTHEKEKHEQLAAKPQTHENKSCSKDKDCSCCNTHGQYVIKENIQSTTGRIHFSAIALSVNFTDSTNLSIAHGEANSVTWPKGNAPPHTLKKPLYISYRSLLI